MGRTARDNRPRVTPVQSVELSEKHVTLRFVLFAVFLLIAIVALGAALIGFLNTGAGWQTIEATKTSNLSCCDDFVFNYKFISGAASTAERKKLTLLYTDTAEKAFALFTNDVDVENVRNVKYINEHPNEEIEVDKALYDAFSLMKEYGARNLYFAPVYEVYDECFTCTDDSQLVSYDPYSSDEVKGFFAQAAVFANDPEMIDLELLDGNRVKLNVSDEYKSFAQENYIVSYIDFNWMKNAFIIDYIASELKASGYLRGSISSYDGFFRTLDTSGDEYAFALYNRIGNTVTYVSQLSYTQPLSMVCLRDYRMNVRDSHYYEKISGETLTPYVDTADGMSRQCRSNMVFYSGSDGCADILMQAAPVYVAESFDAQKVEALKENGVYSIYCEGYNVIDNGGVMTFGELAESYTDQILSNTDE